jgi:hypothetical protein
MSLSPQVLMPDPRKKKACDFRASLVQVCASFLQCLASTGRIWCNFWFYATRRLLAAFYFRCASLWQLFLDSVCLWSSSLQIVCELGQLYVGLCWVCASFVQVVCKLCASILRVISRLLTWVKLGSLSNTRIRNQRLNWLENLLNSLKSSSLQRYDTIV